MKRRPHCGIHCGQGTLWVHTSFGLASSNSGIFLPLPGILLITLILFLDSIALGHLLSLQSKVGEKQNPPPMREPKGPSIFIPAGKSSPPKSCKSVAQTSSQSAARHRGVPQALGLEKPETV
ncbi:unnamed protein product [Rangifer tarandus platyrhynchus]|uniref:Uncharacterized protein n=2 Tax=Rangifer tarandus platyrhynchus TaxID=3082113 RepID=A0AC59YQI2_RANTA|nr:unnamed protein product [Rangifer tarandus platyrhynchus]